MNTTGRSLKPENSLEMSAPLVVENPPQRFGSSRKQLDRSLSPKERLQILKNFLRISFAELADVEYEQSAEGRTIKQHVFGGKQADTIRKLFNPLNTDTPWRAEYAQRIVAWLQQHYHFANAPDDLFVAPLASELEFTNYILFGSMVHQAAPASRRRFGSNIYRTREENELSLILDRIAVSSGNPEYFRKGRDRPKSLAELDAADLNKRVVNHGILVPADKLEAVGQLHEMCAACGLGSEEYPLFAPTLEAIWNRKDEIIKARIGSERDFFGLAKVGTRIAEGSYVSGQLAKAAKTAGVVDGWLTQGLADVDRRDLYDVQCRISEPLLDRPPTLEDPFIRYTEEQFGNRSIEYVGALRCCACRAVATNSSFAKQHIEAARRALAAAAPFLNRRPETVQEQQHYIDFIEIMHTERTVGMESQQMDETIRMQIGIEKIQGLLKTFDYPIYRAKALYWLWRALGRQKTALLDEVKQLISKHPSLKRLCLFDVNAFQREVAVSSSSDKPRSQVGYRSWSSRP
jgi:hypothetical protein